MIDTDKIRTKYESRAHSGVAYWTPAGKVDVCALCDEVDRLRVVICEFARDHSWGAPGWKEKASIKPLFDIAAEADAARKKVKP